MIRVVIVDDSATMRMALARLIEGDPELLVVGAFGDPAAALLEIERLKPDVITSDVDMPGMDGISFVRALQQRFPCPVVMVSSFTTRGSRTTFDALDAGAVDFVAKPKDLAQFAELADELTFKLKAAAKTRMAQGATFEPPTTGLIAGLTSVSRGSEPAVERDKTTLRLVVIGGSTGAPQILPEVLGRLSATSRGVVVAIHMPPGFTRSYADRLQTLLPAISVAEARPGQLVGAGQVVIAPGDFHLRIARSGDSVRIAIDQTPPVARHRPSIDVMFESCARSLGADALGVLLTGMGCDGAAGLLKMKQAGATTLVQRPDSCLVDGMPQAAIANGAASEVMSVSRIAARLGMLARMDLRT